MNRMLVVAALLICIGIVCGVSLLSVWQAKNDLLSRMDELHTLLADPDPDAVVQKAQEIADAWEQTELHLLRYIRHNEIDNTALLIAELPSYAEYGEYSLVDGTIKKLRHLVDHIWTSELPLLRNLF